LSLMNKKRWALVIVVILLLVGYYKLFYKTWSNDGVTKNADCIIALDVKKITNTIIWNFITTPSQWKGGNIFSDEEGKMSWDDMIKIPDYIFVFHKAGQPGNAFYTVMEINDKEDFEKGLLEHHFEKTTTGSYTSTEIGIEFIQSGNKLLLGNAAVEDKKLIQQVADELFTKKQYIATDSLKDYANGDNHLTARLLFSPNDFLQDDYFFITGNFDKENIHFSTSLQTKYGINLTANTFQYCDTSLCSFAFTQPWPDVKKALPDSSWAAISKAVNFNIDSFLLQTNHFYQADIEGIHPRIDSAISYTYDDNFNPVEKVVVNTVEEPAFNFIVQGDSIHTMYNYWYNSGKLEKTYQGYLFTPMPFVKSYCYIKNKKQLSLTSNNYKAAPAKKSIDCVLFFNLSLAKIPASLLKYLPADMVKAIKNFETAAAVIQKEKGQNVLHVTITKKKNDLPIFE
jgi:hypothetical protein